MGPESSGSSGGHPPFRGEFFDAGLRRDRLQQLSGDTGYVIRRDEIEVFREGTLDLLQSEKLIVEARKEFNALKHYGVSVPQFDFVIGPNEQGRPTLFTRVERVSEARDSKTAPGDTPLLGVPETEATRVLTGVARYFLDRLQTGQPYLDDIATSWEQFAYGTTQNDHEPHLYLVDLDPYISRPTADGESPDFTAQTMASNVADLYKIACAGYNRSLPEARQAISDLIDNIDQRHQFDAITWKLLQTALATNKSD